MNWKEDSVNRQTILECLKAEYPSWMNRKTICRKTKLPRTTVFDNLTALLRQGLVEKMSYKGTRTSGRPEIFWRKYKNATEKN